jgi:hypothetical protein
MMVRSEIIVGDKQDGEILCGALDPYRVEVSVARQRGKWTVFCEYTQVIAERVGEVIADPDRFA